MALKSRRMCAVCGRSLPVREFTLNAAGTPSYECRDCVRLEIGKIVEQANLHALHVRRFLTGERDERSAEATPH